MDQKCYMECKRVALIFQGSVSSDGRVRREIQSISQFTKIDVFTSELNPNDSTFFNENVKLIQFELNDSWLNVNLFFRKQFVPLKSLLNPFQYDALVCIDYPTLQLGVDFKRKNKLLKLFYDSHEIYIETINQFFPVEGLKSIYGIPLKIINKIYHAKLERKLIKEVDYIITVCDSLKEYFEKKWNKSVLVLRNCPDLKSLNTYVKGENPYIKIYHCDKGDKILLYHGMINRGRGLMHLIKAMTILSADYKLFIIGSGMLKNDLEKYTAELKLSNVFFIEHLPFIELLNYIEYSHLGISLIEPINLSKKLSLPNKLFEYMSRGVPFLSSDLPESNKILDYGDVGYISSGYDAESVKSSIEKVFSDMSLYELKSNNANKLIFSTFNWENEMRKLIEQI